MSADEARADEVRADEAREDEARADEARADEVEEDMHKTWDERRKDIKKREQFRVGKRGWERGNQEEEKDRRVKNDKLIEKMAGEGEGQKNKISKEQ